MEDEKEERGKQGGVISFHEPRGGGRGGGGGKGGASGGVSEARQRERRKILERKIHLIILVIEVHLSDY